MFNMGCAGHAKSSLFFVTAWRRQLVLRWCMLASCCRVLQYDGQTHQTTEVFGGREQCEHTSNPVLKFAYSEWIFVMKFDFIWWGDFRYVTSWWNQNGVFVCVLVRLWCVCSLAVGVAGLDGVGVCLGETDPSAWALGSRGKNGIAVIVDYGGDFDARWSGSCHQ